MATQIYAKQTVANSQILTANIARFLINDLSGFTGTNWTVIDTYSSGAGTPHEVPSDASNMDSLAADNAWRTNLPLVGDYIVLQSGGTNKCQVMFECQSTTVTRVIVSYEDSWDTTADLTDPTSAANWTKRYISYKNLTTTSASADYTIVATDDSFIMAKLTATHRVWAMGLLADSTEPDGTIFIRDITSGWIRNNAGQVTCLEKRSSDVAFTEVDCREGGWNFSATELFSTYTAYMVDAASGSTNMLSVVVAAANEVYGRIENLYWVRRGLGGGSPSIGTMKNKAYFFIDGSASYAPAGITSDGVTVYS